MPKPLPGKYALYGPKDSKEYIKADFVAKYGYEPPIMRWSGGGWAVGPLPVDAAFGVLKATNKAIDNMVGQIERQAEFEAVRSLEVRCTL